MLLVEASRMGQHLQGKVDRCHGYVLTSSRNSKLMGPGVSEYCCRMRATGWSLNKRGGYQSSLPDQRDELFQVACLFVTAVDSWVGCRFERKWLGRRCKEKFNVDH